MQLSAYRDDKYALGVSFLQSDEDTIGGVTQTELKVITIGGGVKLAEGVGVGFYYTRAKITKPNMPASPSANIAIYGMTIDLRF